MFGQPGHCIENGEVRGIRVMGDYRGRFPEQVRMKAAMNWIPGCRTGGPNSDGPGRRLEPEDFLRLHGTDEFMGIDGCPDEGFFFSLFAVLSG
jgi:hypothetical protein